MPASASSAQRAYTALVSPFASGALPEGLDFDVEGHAKKVAAAAAKLQRRQRESSGVEPMQTGK